MLSMSHTCEVQYWKKKRLRKFKEKNQVSEANIVELIWASLPYKPNSSKFELLLWPESDKHWHMLYDVFPTHLFFPNRTLIDTNCLDWVCVLQDFPAVAPCHTRFAQLPPALASKDPEKDFSLQIQGHSLEGWSAMAVRSSSDWKVQKYLDCIDMHDGACLADMCMVMAEAKISDLRLAGRGGRGCKSIWVWIKTMVTTTRKFGHL